MTEQLPQESLGDNAHRVVLAALSAIPYAGGAAVELFNLVIAPPIQRRRDAWLNDLGEHITKLEQEGRVRVEALQNNEEFISTIMQATLAAIRNHQKEKIDALRNAVLNTAIGKAPEDSKREMFLAFVDIFTVTHLRILKELSRSDTNGRNASRIETSIPKIRELVTQLLPDLRDARELTEVAVEDLCRRGLLFWNRDGGVVYLRQDVHQVSEFGREFLRFISEPQKDD